MRSSDWSSDVCSSDLAITAAVVGVILNLAVWFGIHTLFEQVREVPFAAGPIDLPVLTSVNWPALARAVDAILAMFRFKAGMLPVLGVCSVLGAAYVMIIYRSDALRTTIFPDPRQAPLLDQEHPPCPTKTPLHRI